MHVADVAKAIQLVLEAPFDAVANNVFNVGSEEQNYTISQIGDIIKEKISHATIEMNSNLTDKRKYRVDLI